MVLTQSMQTALKILQCSQLELEHEVSTFLEENIMIEQDVNHEGDLDLSSYELETGSLKNDQNSDSIIENDNSSLDLDQETPFEVIEDWSAHEDSGSFDHLSFKSNGDEMDDFDTNTYEISLEEHLLNQLMLLKLSQKDFVIGAFLIDSLDDNGYFTQPASRMVDALSEQYPNIEIDEDEIMMVLRHIQQFDPPGIGATSLEESLIQQIKQLDPKPYWQEEAIDLLKYHSKWLLQHDLKRIERNYHFLEEEVIEMLEGFKCLNPYPAINYRNHKVEAVKPDIIVLQKGETLTVTLNEDILPKLRINRKYAKLAQRAKIEGRDLMRSQLTEARFFLKSIEDRFDTLLKVATAIVDAQQAFFLNGKKAMKGLRLQDIAEAVSLNESTISRAVAGKYMICSQGTLPLNFFFTNQVSSGEEDASGVAIRAVLQEIIAAEDKKKPFSDQKLQEILETKGHELSRRTVAKYRETLGIPSSTQRKRLV
ncbi:RNA polymerase factor sigma-54 [Wohlfahrtiimonas larvae]|uniref:RNA polymerase sigma-54 factor n=2 Tax=Wohlfahrtiimonas larvae TaxID=1157986 RepID=A0ABP9MIF6_9GAMM